MGKLLRKLRKFFGLNKNSDVLTSPPSHYRHRHEVEQFNSNYDQLPSSFFDAVNMARQEAGYDRLPMFNRTSTNQNHEGFLDGVPNFNVSGSMSFERNINRSPHFNSYYPFEHTPPGTPIKYRRQPILLESLQPNTARPFTFRQRSTVGSPEMHRHFQNVIRHPQRDTMMHYPPQFYPQVPQSPYPATYPQINNMQGWFEPPQQRVNLYF